MAAALRAAVPGSSLDEVLHYHREGLSEAAALAIRRAAAPAAPHLPAPHDAPPQPGRADTRAQAQARTQQEAPSWAVQRWPADDTPPTVEEVYAAAQLLCNHSSPGAEGIDPWLLKQHSVVVWLHRVILAVWHSGVVPAAWREALLVAIWKGKGSQLFPNNFRGKR